MGHLSFFKMGEILAPPLEKMYKMFRSKEILKQTTGLYRLYDVKYNGTLCTKVYLCAGSPLKYEILKSTTHPNILPVYRITEHSVFTKSVVPFSEVFEREKVRYAEYALCKIKSAVEYLHNELQIQHSNISESTLFIDLNGNVLLGGFEKCEEIKNKEDDLCLLNALSRSLINRVMPEDLQIDEVFQVLENKTLFATKSIHEKMSFIEKLALEKDEYPERVLRNIFKLFIDSLSNSKEATTDYKMCVLNALFKIDKNLVVFYSKSLFALLDSTVRMYLLRNMEELGSIGECIDEIILGLRVKDDALRTETVKFIFANENMFDSKAMGYVLEALQRDIFDTSTVGLVCCNLKLLKRDDIYPGIYRLLIEYLNKGKALNEVYSAIEMYLCAFDKFKISNEMLPLLCKKLGTDEYQDECFAIVEKTLKHLKQHKKEIKNKEWSIKGLKDVFISKKKETKVVDHDDLYVINSKTKNGNGWEDSELL
ncbi:hypothetical protein ENBRE01_1361 [Enteropsectra breve]|nr:hypothetical protein ENBRE01_1361 [Enteropsectra breve]